MAKAFIKTSFFTLFIFFFFLLIDSRAQVMLRYYLPENVNYNPNIPTPEAVLGYSIGEWHLTHDQLVSYVKAVAASSDRITVEEIGRTYEKRPQLLLTITSPQNHQNLDKIKKEHRQLANPNPSTSLDTQNMPVVVQLGYGVHGNEASASNASALVVYYLAAAQGEAIENQLKNTVILLDPSFNPDGMQRFSTWVNMHKSKNLVTDPAVREFNEAFPRGRTNHYWFDLNRDWLLLQHPESRARVAKFQEWHPNILTDHHEMGSNSSFFFQPGIPSRTNPLTPAKNQELTAQIGEFHAKALDKINSLYMTKESFDDFYYGKGSSYPDAQGSIGILFEQASARGHARETDNGILTFPFAIRNHFTTSLSTIEAAQKLRKELLDYQRDFYRDAPREKSAYVFGSSLDPARNFHFLDILLRHKIEVRKLKQNLSIGPNRFETDKAYVVSLDQAQVRLIKGIFQTQTEFEDSLFYDVSAWTLPLAFNLPYAKVNSLPSSEALDDITFPKGQLKGNPSEVGYVFNCHGYYTPRALHQLLKKGLKLRVATRETQLSTSEGSKKINYGGIFIPVGIQDMEADELFQLIKKVAEKNALDIYSIKTGLAEQGIDLGSNYLDPVEMPRVLVLVGDGVSSYEAGEVWHLLDQRFDMPVSLVEKKDFGRLDLNRYNTLVMVSGGYQELEGRALDKLKEWVRMGNQIIGIRGANSWLNNAGLQSLSYKSSLVNDSVQKYNYVDRQKLRGAQAIGGAIFEAYLDTTHPLGYGFVNNQIPLFKNSRSFVHKNKNPFTNPLYYQNAPLMSGYISKNNLEMLKNTAAVSVYHYGRGRVISFLDNPNFRAFWYGSNKLFANALFFGSSITP